MFAEKYEIQCDKECVIRVCMIDYSVWDNTAVCDEVCEMWGEV